MRFHLEDVAVLAVDTGGEVVRFLRAVAERIGCPPRNFTSASVTGLYWSRPLTVPLSWLTWVAAPWAVAGLLGLGACSGGRLVGGVCGGLGVAYSSLGAAVYAGDIF